MFFLPCGATVNGHIKDLMRGLKYWKGKCENCNKPRVVGTVKTGQKTSNKHIHKASRNSQFITINIAADRVYTQVG